MDKRSAIHQTSWFPVDYDACDLVRHDQTIRERASSTLRCILGSANGTSVYRSFRKSVFDGNEQQVWWISVAQSTKERTKSRLNLIGLGGNHEISCVPRFFRGRDAFNQGQPSICRFHYAFWINGLDLFSTRQLGLAYFLLYTLHF